MRPDERRGRIKMQLSSASEKLDQALLLLQNLGDDYRGLAGMIRAAREVTESVEVRLSMIRAKEVKDERKG